MLIEMQKAINSGLEDGSIEINFDEEGNISMPTTSFVILLMMFMRASAVIKVRTALSVHRRSIALYRLMYTLTITDGLSAVTP